MARVYSCNDVCNRISFWEKWADEHKDGQMINPFSEWGGHRDILDKNDPNYGRPVEGTLTDRRGKKAHVHVYTEVVELCHIIADIGKLQPDGTYIISFGKLFNAYTRISDKLVGMLIRARRRGYVLFEGEMLYQRQDEDVIITCVHVPELGLPPPAPSC